MEPAPRRRGAAHAPSRKQITIRMLKRFDPALTVDYRCDCMLARPVGRDTRALAATRKGPIVERERSAPTGTGREWIKILLVGEHQLVAEALGFVLSADQEIEVVG